MLSLVVGVALVAGSDDEAAAATTQVRGGLSSAVPAEYQPWLMKAGALCAEFPPAVLAAQLHAESGFNASAVSPAGAQGPAQFMPGTWISWGQDADGDGDASPFDVGDAVMAQGRYDCALVEQVRSVAGSTSDSLTVLALAAYNAGPGTVLRYRAVPPIAETRAYVDRILTEASQFAAPAAGVVAGRAGAVIAAARTQLGVPYSWGGGGPTGPSLGFAQGAGTVGFDCSGLMGYAFAQGAGITLPRVADQQARAGVAVSRAELQPGDVIAFASPGSNRYHHIGLYIGRGQMLHAPQTGEVVTVTTVFGNSYWEGQTWAMRRLL